MRRPAAAALALALVLTVAPAGHAQAPAGVDYDVDNTDWNGLSDLAALAAGMGLTVDARSAIDWDELDANDVLFLLYPTVRLAPAHVAAFIRNGGRVLIADDFGASSEALGRLHLLRDEAIGVAAARFYDDLPFAPIALPRDPDHPLAHGVSELVTNHPAVLSGVDGPDVVFGFGDDEAVVVAGDLGEGRFVALSDPSVLINGMLHFDGNIQFAANLLSYLSRPGHSNRLVVLTGEISLSGEPTDLMDDGTVRGSVSRRLSELNRFLDELNDYLVTGPALRALAVVCALAAALLALLALPLGRGAALDGAWTKASSGAAPLDDYEGLLRRFDDERHRGSYLLPAAVLRDSLEDRLAALVGVRAPLSELAPADLLDQVEARRGPQARRALAALAGSLRGLPTREQAVSPWHGHFLSRREFERLHEGAQALYRTLGEERD